jgi:superfamily II DNA or RNA helicase
MMDEVRKATVRHEAALVYLGVLSETQKRQEEEIRTRNSKWLFEKRLGLMRGIAVEKLKNASVFAADVRKLGLSTAYDLIAAAAKGPIAVGLTVSDVQLSRSTNLKYEIAMAAMSAVKEALDETRDTLRLQLDPDAINAEEKLLLEAVARHINVTNDLPVVMDKMSARLACFTDCVSKARSRSTNPSLMSNGAARTELAEYCKTVTASLERFITDCNEQGGALLLLPNEGPMEVVRRFSDNSAWFYATLGAIVSPSKSKDQVDKRGFTPSGGRHGTGVRRPHGTDTRDLDRDKTDDSDRPKLRPPPDSSIVPYDWGASEDQDELRQTREAEALETEFLPLPDSSEDTDHGHVPLEIAQAVEALELKRGVLKATLRRYQMFGAQFMIQQQRTLLGDDMGLGKTVQSLAAMCHLHALGQRHFLVVAPNSVLINWEREVTTHTGLRPFVLHGTQRLANCAEWSKSGGVGITTYDTAGVLLPHIANIDMLVVDEAHKIKNPKAKRTRRITSAAAKAPIVALMSGTALENRLSELHALVCLAQPEIKAAADYLLSSARPSAEEARRRIAAAYLRRTQVDVLSELPEMTKVDEYVSLSEDERNTEEAMKPHVQNQRIATTIGTGDGNSAKYERLKELLEFYRANGDKVVIFSAFRQVLEDVSKICGGCDQITGEVSPSKRMEMIDRLKAKTGFGCLALQVDAGGQGLNIQFARVVILMEPQFKPSTESQAIARVYRMGQGRKVIVHRLIAKDSIDEDLVELIKYKQQIFDTYANQSAVKDESAMSVDSGTVQQQILDELQRRAEERRARRAAAPPQDASGA